MSVTEQYVMSDAEIATAVRKRMRLLENETLKPSQNGLTKNTARCEMQFSQGRGQAPKVCGRQGTFQESHQVECDLGKKHKETQVVYCDLCSLYRVHAGAYDGPQMEMNLAEPARETVAAKDGDDAARTLSKRRNGRANGATAGKDKAPSEKSRKGATRAVAFRKPAGAKKKSSRRKVHA